MSPGFQELAHAINDEDRRQARLHEIASRQRLLSYALRDAQEEAEDARNTLRQIESNVRSLNEESGRLIDEYRALTGH